MLPMPDFRTEVHNMLHGVPGQFPPQGRWAILQWFDPTKLSKYWNPKNETAVGGPKYQYKMYLMRTSSAPFDITPLLSQGAYPGANGPFPGDLETGAELYIVEHCFNPKKGDYILEYDCEHPESADDFIAMAKVTPATKYRIHRARPVRVDNKIVYYLCSCKLDTERA